MRMDMAGDRCLRDSHIVRGSFRQQDNHSRCAVACMFVSLCVIQSGVGIIVCLCTIVFVAAGMEHEQECLDPEDNKFDSHWT